MPAGGTWVAGPAADGADLVRCPIAARQRRRPRQPHTAPDPAHRGWCGLLLCARGLPRLLLQQGCMRCCLDLGASQRVAAQHVRGVRSHARLCVSDRAGDIDGFMRGTPPAVAFGLAMPGLPAQYRDGSPIGLLQGLRCQFDAGRLYLLHLALPQLRGSGCNSICHRSSAADAALVRFVCGRLTPADPAAREEQQKARRKAHAQTWAKEEALQTGEYCVRWRELGLIPVRKEYEPELQRLADDYIKLQPLLWACQLEATAEAVGDEGEVATLEDLLGLTQLVMRLLSRVPAEHYPAMRSKFQSVVEVLLCVVCGFRYVGVDVLRLEEAAAVFAGYGRRVVAAPPKSLGCMRDIRALQDALAHVHLNAMAIINDCASLCCLPNFDPQPGPLTGDEQQDQEGQDSRALQLLQGAAQKLQLQAGAGVGAVGQPLQQQPNGLISAGASTGEKMAFLRILCQHCMPQLYQAVWADRAAFRGPDAPWRSEVASMTVTYQLARSDITALDDQVGVCTVDMEGGKGNLRQAAALWMSAGARLARLSVAVAAAEQELGAPLPPSQRVASSQHLGASCLNLHRTQEGMLEGACAQLVGAPLELREAFPLVSKGGMQRPPPPPLPCSMPAAHRHASPGARCCLLLHSCAAHHLSMVLAVPAMRAGADQQGSAADRWRRHRQRHGGPPGCRVRRANRPGAPGGGAALGRPARRGGAARLPGCAGMDGRTQRRLQRVSHRQQGYCAAAGRCTTFVCVWGGGGRCRSQGSSHGADAIDTVLCSYFRAFAKQKHNAVPDALMQQFGLLKMVLDEATRTALLKEAEASLGLHQQ